MNASVELSQRISVDVATAAELVGVSPSTIRAAIRGGDLGAHYVGVKPVVLIDELRAWVSSKPTSART